MTRTVGIVGTGLIGASVGLALHARGASVKVVGYDRDADALARARARGAIDDISDDVASLVEADLVIVATPIEGVEDSLRRLDERGDPTCTVTDVCSVKAGVVAVGEAILGGRFVGGHPMAGSETHGVDAADDQLFDDAWWILTPTETTAPDAYRAVTDLVTALGARSVAVPPETHDELVARLSHVPQIVASAIVAAAAHGSEQSLLQLAGNGFRDVTRIAASDPQLWTGIVAANSKGVLEALGTLRATLDDVERVVATGAWDELTAWLDRARHARTTLFAKAQAPEQIVGLEMIVPDRPGVLAEVTTAAGRLGANIEDLRIIHSTEGGRGRLEVLIAGAEPAAALRRDLEALGYHVRVVVAEL